jgi:large subunit ribosomal protein L18
MKKTSNSQNIQAKKAITQPASTIEPEIRKELSGGGSVGAASVIGKRIAEKATKIGITKVGFDRSGFKYHGRIKALAEAAREHGLVF